MERRRKLPPLNALRAFEAAARHVSFKAAAEELFVTSTAISHQIRQLEGLIGLKLFERATRSVALTDAGRRLYPVLREGFDRFALAVADLSEDGHSVRLGVTPAFAAKVVIPSLPHLDSEYPDIRLTIDAGERLVDVAHGEVDLAVRYGPRQRPPGMYWNKLADDHYVAAASPRWLEGRVAPIEPQVLARERLLIYAWKNDRLVGPTWARWMEHAGVGGFDDSACMSFSEESHAIQAAIDGAGVVLASDVLIAADLRDGRLVQVSRHVLPGFEFQILVRQGHPKIETIRVVEQWLEQIVHVPHAAW